MLVGMIAMGVIVSIFTYTSAEGRAIHNFKKQYPVAGIAVILLGGCFITYTLGSLLVFLTGILMPFCGKNQEWLLFLNYLINLKVL